jgi:preprotein translocase SecE subunit
LNVANKMADKKKSAGQSSSRTQAPVPTKAQASEKAQVSEKTQSAKNTRTTTRDERKEQGKQESKPIRRETKASPGLVTRVRNSRVGRFVLDAYYELRHKVTWPTFEEARNMTIVVIGLSAVIAALLGLADLGLYRLFLLISGGH